MNINNPAGPAFFPIEQAEDQNTPNQQAIPTPPADMTILTRQIFTNAPQTQKAAIPEQVSQPNVPAPILAQPPALQHPQPVVIISKPSRSISSYLLAPIFWIAQRIKALFIVLIFGKTGPDHVTYNGIDKAFNDRLEEHLNKCTALGNEFGEIMGQFKEGIELEDGRPHAYKFIEIIEKFNQEKEKFDQTKKFTSNAIKFLTPENGKPLNDALQSLETKAKDINKNLNEIQRQLTALLRKNKEAIKEFINAYHKEILERNSFKDLAEYSSIPQYFIDHLDTLQQAYLKTDLLKKQQEIQDKCIQAFRTQILENLDINEVNLGGIPNIGNSCYQNSVCQAMFAVPSIVKQLFDNPKDPQVIEKPVDPKPSDFEETSAGKKLFAEARTQHEKEVKSYNSRMKIQQEEKAKYSPLRKALQNLLINMINENPTKNLKPSAQQIRNVLFDKKMINEGEEKTGQHDAMECAGVFIDSLGLGISTQFQCTETCSAGDVNGKKTADYKSLLIPLQGQETNLTDYMKKFCDEDIDDPTNKWRGRDKYHKNISLTEAPEFLVIGLKRFEIQQEWNKELEEPTHVSKKINDNVNIPDELDLKPFILSEKTEGQEKVLYKLKSYVIHEGDSLQFGHYTANVLKAHDKYKSWFKTNDEAIPSLLTSKDEAKQRKQAYVFFYERVKD